MVWWQISSSVKVWDSIFSLNPGNGCRHYFDLANTYQKPTVSVWPIVSNRKSLTNVHFCSCLLGDPGFGNQKPSASDLTDIRIFPVLKLINIQTPSFLSSTFTTAHQSTEHLTMATEHNPINVSLSCLDHIFTV